jgi:hypothetical protein
MDTDITLTQKNVDDSSSIRQNIIKLVILWRMLILEIKNLWLAWKTSGVTRKATSSQRLSLSPIREEPEEVASGSQQLWHDFRNTSFSKEEDSDSEFVPETSDGNESDVSNVSDESDDDNLNHDLLPEALLLERDLIDSDEWNRQIIALDQEDGASPEAHNPVRWEDLAIRRAISNTVSTPKLTRTSFRDYVSRLLSEPDSSKGNEGNEPAAHSLLDSFISPSTSSTPSVSQERQEQGFVAWRRRGQSVQESQGEDAPRPRLCVVCQYESRNIILKPCNCLSLCDTCRELMASRRFSNCPCCRQPVLGYCKIFEP